MLVKRLTETAKLPTRGSPDAAGLDLYADELCNLSDGMPCAVRTGIAVAIPQGYAGFVWPRSGLAAKHGVQVLAGLIDADYRGELKVLLTSVDPIAVSPGDRIAQLVIQPVEMGTVEEAETLPETVRGHDGFGSTGA